MSFLDDASLNKKIVGMTNAQIAFVQDGQTDYENYYVITGIWEDNKPYVASFWHHTNSPFNESREHSLPEHKLSQKNNIKIAPLIMPKNIGLAFLESLKGQSEDENTLKKIDKAITRIESGK